MKTTDGSNTWSSHRLWMAAALISGLASGCAAASRFTPTPRSGVEQQLISRSLERAVSKIDARPFQGKRVWLELFGLAGDREFARELIIASLREKGVQIANQPDDAELQLKVFTTSWGVDRGEDLLGIPSLTVPVVGVPVPEIPIYKSIQNRGIAEIQIFAFDGRSGALVEKSPLAVGKSKYDNYTILFAISFTRSDLDKKIEGKKP